MILKKSRHAVDHDLAGIFTAHGQLALALKLDGLAGLIKQMGNLLLDVVGKAFFDDHHRILAGAEVEDLAVDQRVDAVQAQNVDLGVAIDIGQIEPVERPDHRVVAAAGDDQPDLGSRCAEPFVDPAFDNELLCRGAPFGQLFLLVKVGRGRQDDPVKLALGGLKSVRHR